MFTFNEANGQLNFKGDEKVMAKVEGLDLSGVEVPTVVRADELSRAFNEAEREGGKEVLERDAEGNPTKYGDPVIEKAKYYAVCKEKYIEQFEERKAKGRN